MLELAGIDPPEEFGGRRELLSAIVDGASETPRPAFAELVAPLYVGYSVRDERFKRIRMMAPELTESVFDLEIDPQERDSLLSNPPASAGNLASALERFIQLGQHGLHLAMRGETEGER